ncbi:bifunctional UDP-N-acetylglucosamine diphosphorylase/glucosamine-1-phosphate N-acetyltransferase GlmU [Corynebacterium choanae]|nr:bifunctional UDP-N-acetylglucosamine diphosphorylase/glucosamine-1-phosphate N-acetyltransferase GlmU [Corynebacterium choanae]
MTNPSQSNLAVVILAAGAGTRMRSQTPKMLHEVAGRTMLEHALHAACGTHPDHVVVVTGHCRQQVQATIDSVNQRLVDDYGVAGIQTVVQKEQNGTGDAVATALAAPALRDFRGTIIVTTSDVPLIDAATLTSLVAEHTTRPQAAVTILTTTVDNPTGYGRIVRTHDGEVTKIVEEKDADTAIKSINEINSGVYAFDAELLGAAVNQLDTNNAQGEFYLTDVVGIARDLNKLVRAHRIDDAAIVSGVNDRVQLAAMNKEFNRRLREHHMRAGVTMVDPDSVFIDVDVHIEQDVVIAPNCQLRGNTTIATGCVIGPDTTLTNVTVDNDAAVIRTTATDSTIGARAQVGPYTYLRPGTKLAADGKLGGFVETKNATIGQGTKVPHLTYVGDATIGEHSNIGASSVFVNYDGVNKHHTTIGSHVRTGSDTMFIAPVTVGDGAYSGAGTVIKHDVPPGALVVSAGKQRIIEDWVKNNRPGTPAAEAAAACDATGTPPPATE